MKFKKLELIKVEPTTAAKLKDGEYFEEFDKELKKTLLVTNKGRFFTLQGLRAYFAQLSIYGDVKKNKIL